MDTQKEKAILVGVKTYANGENFESSMKELKNLTKTAEGEVVLELTQNLQEIDRKTVIGKGKLQELAELIEAHEANLVIFNHELSPRQANNIEEVLNVKVLDRVQLILDIFAMRARSREGKLQVELAQLQYVSQRLSGGSGLALSRQGGGIGARGAGESKLETDRRHIRTRITMIKKELKEIAAHRLRMRDKRRESNVFQIGLIGYTNAGKSTILNLLTSANTYEENQLFATLDPLTKKWMLPQGMIVTLTDTVGFIQDLPTQLVEAFQSTLEESKNVDLLLHVVDASNPYHIQHEETVLELLKELEMESLPILTVYNKSDKLTEEFTPTLFPNVLISSKSTVGKEALTDAVRKRMMEIMEPYDFSLFANQGKELHDLRVESILLIEEYREETNDYHVKGFAKTGSKWVSEKNTYEEY
ncbi:GTP-binding protein HflX [Pilibacter termitis]|uniref:GTPase HflX n=1 Tax=Pilibacter termitis TaxID=263852 RepID=A0A1T4N8T2_9ENTE|nr:GTPase HflX [Pilibacter termitis]SJZ75639.1 GTP-binding protein HflX [Pilibacter termitis]